jgi:hypothetical protein
MGQLILLGDATVFFPSFSPRLYGISAVAYRAANALTATQESINVV